MTQNRKKLIDLFIGNISNSIVHKILEKAIDNNEIINKYIKEQNISLEIAKKYRERINPTKTINVKAIAIFDLTTFSTIVTSFGTTLNISLETANEFAYLTSIMAR